jgi:integrase
MTESGLKKRWDAVRVAANLPWLRPYDLRHTGISRMAEAGVPIEVAMSMVGHMTMQMHRHYTEISSGSQRRWMNATWGSAGGREGASAKKPPRSVADGNQNGNGFTQKMSQRA